MRCQELSLFNSDHNLTGKWPGGNHFISSDMIITIHLCTPQGNNGLTGETVQQTHNKILPLSAHVKLSYVLQAVLWAGHGVAMGSPLSLIISMYLYHSSTFRLTSSKIGYILLPNNKYTFTKEILVANRINALLHWKCHLLLTGIELCSGVASN